jgi:hypothetical protein
MNPYIHTQRSERKIKVGIIIMPKYLNKVFKIIQLLHGDFSIRRKRARKQYKVDVKINNKNYFHWPSLFIERASDVKQNRSEEKIAINVHVLNWIMCAPPYFISAR